MRARINRKLFDYWSLIHFAFGFAIGWLFVAPLEWAIILIVLWEIFEHVLKTKYDIFNIPFGRKSVMESPGNSIMDIIIGLSGYLLGFYMLTGLLPW